MTQNGVSIFIPVYNEAKILKKNVKKLEKYIISNIKGKYEIVIVSNGSTDSTEKIGQELTSKTIKFYATKKQGVGLAIKIGIKHFKFDKVITVDMDLSTDLNFIKKAANLLENHDIVVGSKLIGEQERKIHRLLLSKTFILLTKIILGIGYQDYSIAAKGYKTSILVNNLKNINNGSSYVINILFYSKNKKIIEIPVICNDQRKSKFNLLHEIWHRFYNLIRLRLKSAIP